MRSIAVACAIAFEILFSLCAPADALGAGATTCGQYLRTSHRTRGAINEWILGYATGANEVGHLVFRRDFISGLGQKTLFDSVTVYCRRNPSISLQNAAQDFLEFVRQTAAQ